MSLKSLSLYAHREAVIEEHEDLAVRASLVSEHPEAELPAPKRCRTDDVGTNSRRLCIDDFVDRSARRVDLVEQALTELGWVERAKNHL